MKQAFLSFVTVMALLSGCAPFNEPPRAAYFNRGTPESLLDVSSEVVNLPVATALQVNELSSWVNRDQPTRAELYCRDSDPQCRDAAQALELFSVPTAKIPSAQSTVTLVYERTLARDCESRFIDNRDNPHNLNHPTFGCSMAANIVQHVSDKQQFVNPDIMGVPDAKKAVQAAQRAQERPAEQEVNSVTRGITSAIQE
jgi:hypothetical protein